MESRQISIVPQSASAALAYQQEVQQSMHEVDEPEQSVQYEENVSLLNNK